jgi:toxin ParE1/3/4
VIVHLSAEAEVDLESIGDHIAQDSPARAISFIQELRAACMDLARMARAFPLVERYERQGVRRRVHGNYLIFYREEAGRVVVLHVLHGAMDYAAILFPT